MRGAGFINKMIELIQADGKTVAVAGNEFYVNAAEGADAKEADADVVIQVAVPAQTTVELCSTEAQAILSKENCIAIFGSNQVAAEGVLAANANLNVLGSEDVYKRQENDVEGQNRILKQAILKNPDAILISPSSFTESNSLLQEARDQGYGSHLLTLIQKKVFRRSQLPQTMWRQEKNLGNLRLLC